MLQDTHGVRKVDERYTVMVPEPEHEIQNNESRAYDQPPDSIPVFSSSRDGNPSTVSCPSPSQPTANVSIWKTYQNNCTSVISSQDCDYRVVLIVYKFAHCNDHMQYNESWHGKNIFLA